jgi:hypothetical protein
LLHAPATAFAFTQEANSSFNTYEFKSGLTPDRYCVYVPGGTIPTDVDENINTILEDAKMICDYAKDHNMSIPDAVEYLNSCHSCGNTDIPFGNEYCNEKCRDEFTVFNYPSFKDADCKVCLNYRREENLRREKEYPQHKWYCKAIGCDKEFCDYRDDSYRQEECCDKECCDKECCEKEDERLYNLKRTKWEFRWFGQDTDDENEDTF